MVRPRTASNGHGEICNSERHHLLLFHSLGAYPARREPVRRQEAPEPGGKLRGHVSAPGWVPALRARGGLTLPTWQRNNRFTTIKIAHIIQENLIRLQRWLEWPKNRSDFGGRSRSLGVVIASFVAMGMVAGAARAWAEGLVVPGADQSVAPARKTGGGLRVSAEAVLRRQPVLRHRHIRLAGFPGAGVVDKDRRRPFGDRDRRLHAQIGPGLCPLPDGARVLSSHARPHAPHAAAARRCRRAALLLLAAVTQEH